MMRNKQKKLKNNKPDLKTIHLQNNVTTAKQAYVQLLRKLQVLKSLPFLLIYSADCCYITFCCRCQCASAGCCLRSVFVYLLKCSFWAFGQCDSCCLARVGFWKFTSTFWENTGAISANEHVKLDFQLENRSTEAQSRKKRTVGS